MRNATNGSRRTSSGIMLRDLLRAGCTPTEAANLYAVAVGLRPVRVGWTVAEIERLKFLRHLVETKRLAS